MKSHSELWSFASKELHVVLSFTACQSDFCESQGKKHDWFVLNVLIKNTVYNIVALCLLFAPCVHFLQVGEKNQEKAIGCPSGSSAVVGTFTISRVNT